MSDSEAEGITQENNQLEENGAADDGPVEAPIAADGRNLSAQQQAEFASAVTKIRSGVRTDEFEATVVMRKLLSIERNPPVEMVIKAGVVPYLLKFLERDDTTLQFEACWALTNIASSSSAHTKHVVACIPICIEILNKSVDQNLIEQCIWCLGNLAGDSVALRNKVLAAQALPAILKHLSPSSVMSLLRNGAWTVSNLCRGKPKPAWKEVKAALPTLTTLLMSTDSEVLTDVAWAFSYLSDGDNNLQIQAIIDCGVVKRFVELLRHSNVAVVTPCLRTVGNIVTGDDLQTQIVISSGVLPHLGALMTNPKKGIVKEALWALSNITAGNQSQIQAFLDAGILKAVLQVLNDGSTDLRKEACWVVSNMTSGGSTAQLQVLVTSGALKPLIKAMEIPEPRIKHVVLEGINNIIKQSSNFKMGTAKGGPTPRRAILLAIKNQGGLKNINERDADDESVRSLVQNIVTAYRSEGISWEELMSDGLPEDVMAAFSGLDLGDEEDVAEKNDSPKPNFSFT